MPSNEENPLAKAVNLGQLRMVHNAAVHFDETAPSEDVIDEYSRITNSLYQALEDAQQVITPAQEATGLANAKALLAQQAASAANTAASSANSAASAAENAAAEMEEAKETYQTIAARLALIDVNISENTDPMSLISQ